MTDIMPSMEQAPVQRIPIFQFGDKKVETIDRDLLSKSNMVLDNKDRPYKTRPVQTWQLLDDMEQIIREQGINYSLDPIYVQANSSKRILTQDEKAIYTAENTPIGKWVFNDMITRFHLPHAEDETGQTGRNIGIAVCFHKKGITMSWGLNENICENFSILTRSTLQTFGSDDRKKDYDMIKLQVADWLRHFEDKRALELEMMDKMKNTVIEGGYALDKLIGKLYRKAVDQAYGSKSIAPFTINSMSNFVQEIDCRRTESVLQEDPNLYEVYNFGTSVMKPGMVDMGDIIEVSSLFAEFLLKEFNLN